MTLYDRPIYQAQIKSSWEKMKFPWKEINSYAHCLSSWKVLGIIFYKFILKFAASLRSSVNAKKMYTQTI